jgi:hypothetical protein
MRDFSLSRSLAFFASIHSSGLLRDLANASLLAAVIASASLAQGCAVEEAPTEARRSTTSHEDQGGGAAAAGRGTLEPMYMQFSATTGDWIMSRTAGEGAPEYHYNGIQFYGIAVGTNTHKAVPIYRCLDAHGTHYQSTLFQCESEGSKQEGLLTYVYAEDPGDGAKQIWRCISPTGRPIIATLNLDDCKVGGFIVQFALGWAYPASIAQAPAKNGAASAGTLVPMNMSWDDDGDWLMSRSASEGAPKYHFNGFEFLVLDSAPANAPVPVQPLYRCLDKYGTHYQSNLFACESEGSTEESLLGYVYARDPGNGAMQVWRCIHPSGKTIVATLSPQAVCTNAGMTIQLSLGWAFPASFAAK